MTGLYYRDKPTARQRGDLNAALKDYIFMTVSGCYIESIEGKRRSVRPLYSVSEDGPSGSTDLRIRHPQHVLAFW